MLVPLVSVPALIVPMISISLDWLSFRHWAVTFPAPLFVHPLRRLIAVHAGTPSSAEESGSPPVIVPDIGCLLECRVGGGPQADGDRVDGGIGDGLRFDDAVDASRDGHGLGGDSEQQVVDEELGGGGNTGVLDEPVDQL